MTRLNWVMTAGTGCLLFLLLATLVDRQRDWKATQAWCLPVAGHRDC